MCKWLQEKFIWPWNTKIDLTYREMITKKLLYSHATEKRFSILVRVYIAKQQKRDLKHA